MNKSVLIIVLVVFLGGGAAFALMNKDDKKDDNTNSSNQSSASADDHDSMNAADDHSEESSAETKQGQVAVDIKDFAYSQKKLKVKKGTTVTWTNQDSVSHDVAPDESSDDFKGSGGLLSKGKSYSFTFNTVGNFSYHCTPHPDMVASVEVVE